MLFDGLLVGPIVANNPANPVRGPKYLVKKGQNASFVDRRDARPVCRLPGRCGRSGDRPQLATIASTFARIGAVLHLRVEDYDVQGRGGWLRLHEKGGKVNDVPYRHALEQFLDEYIDAATIAVDSERRLFRPWRGGALQRRELDQSSVHRLVRLRLRQADIRCRARNYSFPVTGSSMAANWSMRSRCPRMPAREDNLFTWPTRR